MSISQILGTAPIAPAVWLLIIPFALAMLALEELRNWIARWRCGRAVALG